MWKSHKFKGIGYYNFMAYYTVRYGDDLVVSKVQQPHNIFIQMMSELGTLGLIIYLILIKSTFLIERREQPGFTGFLAPGFNAAFVGFLVAGQFVTVGYYPFMWMHLAFVVCVRNIDKNIVAFTKSNTIASQ